MPALGPLVARVPAGEPDLRQLPHAKACACVAKSVIAYRDEDGDPSCTRCGRHLAIAMAPVRSVPDELARRRAVA